MTPKAAEAPSDHAAVVARELEASVQQVRATAALLAGGATVPFIARYRKEATGSLDEVAIATVRDRMGQLAELDKRRDAILDSLSERGLLDDDLRRRIAGADTLPGLEDIYLPHRPKRRTRAMVAREAGLEPLARALLAQGGVQIDLTAFEDRDAALSGARDIIAEDVAAGRLVPAEVDEAAVARRLYTAAWPDPDLLIRTSGELRLSNFLLWQLAYAELFVTPVLWPDFTRHDFFEAVVEFQRRDRRFGRVPT